MLRKLHKKRRIALIAHDRKKLDLIDWVKFNRETLSEYKLYGTGTTANLILEEANLNIIQLLSGPLGGDQQIGSMIAENKIDIVIFFWDPMSAQPHDTDVKALIRLCAVWNVPIACNKSTADFLISSPLMHNDYQLQIPDYTSYIDRKIS